MGECFDLGTSFQRIRVGVRDMVLVSTPYSYETKLATVLDLSKSFDNAAALLYKTVTADSTKEALQKLIKAKGIYMDYLLNTGSILRLRRQLRP